MVLCATRADPQPCTNSNRNKGRFKNLLIDTGYLTRGTHTLTRAYVCPSPLHPEGGATPTFRLLHRVHREPESDRDPTSTSTREGTRKGPPILESCCSDLESSGIKLAMPNYFIPAGIKHYLGLQRHLKCLSQSCPARPYRPCYVPYITFRRTRTHGGLVI